MLSYGLGHQVLESTSLQKMHLASSTSYAYKSLCLLVQMHLKIWLSSTYFFIPLCNKCQTSNTVFLTQGSFKTSLPFLHCHLRLSCLLKMTLRCLHCSHSCHDLRFPLTPLFSLLRKQQVQATEVEFPQCDLRDRQSWYQTCRSTVSESSEPPTFTSLPVNLDHQHLFQAPSLCYFDVSSQPTVLFHEDTIVMIKLLP